MCKTTNIQHQQQPTTAYRNNFILLKHTVNVTKRHYILFTIVVNQIAFVTPTEATMNNAQTTNAINTIDISYKDVVEYNNFICRLSVAFFSYNWLRKQKK